jgi:hypothetical protein
MSVRVTIGIIALACISICGLISTFTQYEIVDQVNAKLPKSEQFDSLWWYASKTLRLHSEYKRLYPEGRLLFKFRVLMALMVSCLLVCAWALGFFAR